MKNSRGFCLVQELVCFCLTAVLLATAIQGFYRSNYLLNESLELQQAVQAAQQVLAGEEYSGRFDVTQRISSGSTECLAVQEVQAAYGKVRVTLIRALPTAEGLSASGAAAGTFKATGTAGLSFGRLQDELQLQEARRHILAQLEKIVCYDAQSVRLQTDGKISCRMLEGCKQVTVYSDKQGIYQRTRTNKGTGVNPVSLEEVGVFGWQVRRCSPQMLCVSFDLYRNGRSMRVTQYFICYSARITDDA